MQGEIKPQNPAPEAKAALVLYRGIDNGRYLPPWLEVAKTSGGTVVTSVDSDGTETTLTGTLSDPECYRVSIDGG